MTDICNHTTIVCPNHKGSFDCTPFCSLCEGNQESCSEYCKAAMSDNYEQWVEQYKPMTNAITNDGLSYETYGDELEYILLQDDKHIWTEMDGDNGVHLVNGYHYANRIAYYITNVPWQEDEDICITICEHVVCPCYNEETDTATPDCQECYGVGTYTDWK